MNNPDDMPVDAEELIEWLKRYKSESSKSWSVIASESGIPTGTISQIAGGSYAGNIQAQARKLFRYRQTIDAQREMARSALEMPPFVATPTAQRIEFAFQVAQMGRIVVIATGPGTGKTMTAEHYQASASNVWLVTMRQSTKSVSAMIAQVMTAMGLLTKSGWTQQRSNQVIEYVTGKKGLVIIDEANHLDRESLEELRGWHDATGLGIALCGNEELAMRIRGNGGGHAFARLNSRIAQMHIQDLPREEDVTAFLDALDIVEPAMRKPLIDRGLSPSHGGLREVRQILETANMLAIGADQPLSAAFVKQAMDMRATDWRRRAA